ncbi:MAG: FtsX-like permease family protein, partial [Duncaniella sp.]|nr:FtsX-like permease family protein [Duncaniella sp.]
FFRDTMINPRMVYALLVAVLLLVPAIGIAGLVNAQMQSRYSEMAIRKTYGATNASIIRRLFMENLVSTLVGAVAGYVIAAIVVIAGRSWMFGGVIGDVTIGGGLLLNPLTLLYATLACLVLTTVISLIPARRAVTQKIYITLKGEE